MINVKAQGVRLSRRRKQGSEWASFYEATILAEQQTSVSHLLLKPWLQESEVRAGQSCIAPQFRGDISWNSASTHRQ